MDTIDNVDDIEQRNIATRRDSNPGSFSP